MTAPTPNAELAYMVLDHIDAHPEQWNQGRWALKSECGTVGCFAGWAVMLSGAEPNTEQNLDATVEFNGRSRIVSELAEELLGASRWTEAGDGESDDLNLFDQFNTREDLGRLVEEIFGPRPDGAS